ncbi:HD domain-containing protein [Cardinium endosymbiont of Philonthus spinipes]|uniref:HD domain-containing protein n=1 Tax=Cardinium endosymbiont of Philonthus spinipes TaxID=3077941 RepID=UPI00313B7C40
MGIDCLIIIVFLVITLALGLYCSKSVATFKHYAVGNKQMPTVVLTASLIATVYGGGFLTTRLNAYYYNGLYTLVRDLVLPIGFYLISRFLIVRMRPFIGHLSVAESMGILYGQTIRIITAFFGILMAIAIVSIQFKVGLSISHIIFPDVENIPILWAIILSLIVITYSSFGGAKPVAFTDVCQFLLFFVCFPVVILILLHYTYHPWDNCKALMQIPKFNPIEVCTWNNVLHTITAYAALMLFPMNPALIQRIYMSSSLQQAARVFRNTAVIRIIFSLLAFSVAIMLHIGGHTPIQGQHVLDYVIHLDYFPGIKGLLVSSIIALLMSTADSDLHVASVLCTNDLFPFLLKKFSIFRTPSLKIARISAVTIGIVSIFIAFYATSILQLLNKSALFYTTVITVPFILPCFGFKPCTVNVLCSMAISTTLIAYIIFVKEQVIEQSDILKFVVMSTCISFALHYLLPKKPNTGWIGIPDYSPVILQNQETKRWWLRKIQYIQSVFTISYWSDIFPKQTSIFISFGIYLTIYSSISLLCIQKIYLDSYIYWYITVMAIGTIIALYPAMHIYQKEGNSLLYGLWPILLYVALFISGIVYMKLSCFTPISCALFIVNVGLSSLLLPYTIIIAMISVTLLIYKWMPPHVALMNYKGLVTTEIMVGLTILLSCLVYRYIRIKFNKQLQIIALDRHYEQKYALASLHNQANWNRLDPTYNGKIVQDIADTLDTSVDKLQIEKHREKLYTLSRFLLQRAKEERTFTLDPKAIQQVKIDSLILQSYESIKGLGKPIQLLLKNKTIEKYLLTEPAILERLFTINFWNICRSKKATEDIITLTITNTLVSYPYYTRNDHEKQLIPPILPALAFSISTETDSPEILPTYEITDKIPLGYLPKTINNLYQEESRQIVQAHGGYMQTIETATSLTCLYILPVDGKKVMQFKRYHTNDLSNKVAETDESLAQEKALISLLISKTTLTEQKIQETISFIKKAHGTTIRKSGDPYYTHPMEVAKIVLEATKNANTILAALLHDVVEDTMVTLEQIELQYGPDIAYVVDMVTHYNTHGYRWKLDNSDNQVILNKCKDIRVVQIKLADRLHNLRTINVRKPEEQKRIAKDTMEFYIPWARKNNVLTWLTEMEDICEQILNVNTM